MQRYQNVSVNAHIKGHRILVLLLVKDKSTGHGIAKLSTAPLNSYYIPFGARQYGTRTLMNGLGTPFPLLLMFGRPLYLKAPCHSPDNNHVLTEFHVNTINTAPFHYNKRSF